MVIRSPKSRGIMGTSVGLGWEGLLEVIKPGLPLDRVAPIPLQAGFKLEFVSLSLIWPQGHLGPDPSFGVPSVSLLAPRLTPTWLRPSLNFPAFHT